MDVFKTEQKQGTEYNDDGFEMKQKIIEHLKRIEEEKKIKILFAVESGSRAWGMASEDSDYDIRFVYYYPANRYIEIDSVPDVIDFTDKDNNLDFVGFDLLKFSRLLWSSNPAAIEWLRSNIVYYGEQPKELIEFSENHFKPFSLYHHYKSMCKQNYLKYLKSGDMVTYKKYLYAMRGLMNAKWVEDFQKIPPIKFPEVINGFWETVPQDIILKLTDIVRLKRCGKEKDIIQNISRIDNYIESFLKEPIGFENQKTHVTTRDLNQFIVETIIGSKFK